MSCYMFKKKCKVCNTNKGVDNFAKHSSGKYGVRTICKECNKQLGKLYRQKNIELISLQLLRYKFHNFMPSMPNFSNRTLKIPTHINKLIAAIRTIS